MALTEITINFNVHQLLGGDFDTRRTKAYVKTNIANGTIQDTSTGETRIGDQTVTIASDGTGSWTTWAPEVGVSNPASWQESLILDYPRTGQRDRQTRTFGPYTLAAANDGDNITDLEDEQAIPAEYQTAFTEAAQAYLDAQATIAGIDDSDSAVAGLIEDELVGPLTNAALDDRTVQPLIRDTDYSVAKLYYVNVKDFGAVGDYENSAHDDTAAFQAAIDACSAAGGGIVQVPPGKYRISQIVLKHAVWLRGTCLSDGGITPDNIGSELIQKEGTDLDLIRVSEVIGHPDGTVAVPFGLSHFIMYGRTGATGGSAFALKTEAGVALKWVHGCFAEHLYLRRFAGDGMWIGGGSGVQNIRSVFGFKLGGYTIRIEGDDADMVQHVNLFDISGDGNLGDSGAAGGGGAVVRIESQAAGYATVITGLKSEQIVNEVYAAAGAPANVNALQIHNCASFFTVRGVQHIASGAAAGGSATIKPGDAIKITGDTGIRPTVEWAGVKIRTLSGQVTGTTPALLHDTSNSGDRSIPQDVITGCYGSTADVRFQALANTRAMFGYHHVLPKPSTVTNEVSAAGDTPGFVWYALNGATDEKLWHAQASSSGKTWGLRMAGDDGVTGSLALQFERSGKTLTKAGIAGFLPTIPTYTQTYSTSDRTLGAYTSDPESSAYTGSPADAASTAKLADLNALRTAYENLRVFTEDLAAFVNAIVDDQQANGWFK